MWALLGCLQSLPASKTSEGTTEKKNKKNTWQHFSTFLEYVLWRLKKEEEMREMEVKERVKKIYIHHPSSLLCLYHLPSGTPCCRRLPHMYVQFIKPVQAWASNDISLWDSYLWKQANYSVSKCTPSSVLSISRW